MFAYATGDVRMVGLGRSLPFYPDINISYIVDPDMLPFLSEKEWITQSGARRAKRASRCLFLCYSVVFDHHLREQREALFAAEITAYYFPSFCLSGSTMGGWR